MGVNSLVGSMENAFLHMDTPTALIAFLLITVSFWMILRVFSDHPIATWLVVLGLCLLVMFGIFILIWPDFIIGLIKVVAIIWIVGILAESLMHKD